MKNFLKVILAILILAVLCVIGYAGWYYYNDKNTSNSQNNSQQTNNVPNQNKTEVETEENKEEDNKEEEKEEEKAEESQENQEEKKEEETSNEEGNISDEDKAIELAKKQYGMTDGVYFRIEQVQSNGVYIISVRDSETTRDYAWYTVNVNNNTVQ